MITGRENPHWFKGHRVYISKKRQFIWVSVPKAASSSLRSLISTIEAVENIPFTKLSISSMKSLPKYQSYYTFCFVRNPWARLLSLYKNKIEPRPVLYHHLLRHRYGVIIDNLTTFEDFIKFIGKVPNCFSEAHFAPYHILFRPTEMDFIGHQENFEADVHHLMNVIAPELKNIEIPQQNISNESISNHTNYREYYSKRMKNIVARKYAKDIDFFNYKF